MAKSKECVVYCYTSYGYMATPYRAKSIAEGVRWARESGWWRYYIQVDGKTVRQGYCTT